MQSDAKYIGKLGAGKMVELPTTIRNGLRPVKHATLRVLGVEPLQKVIKRIEHRNYQLADMAALEVFGGRGDSHLRDYASKVQNLTIWEINQEACHHLKWAFPMAEVKCVDSYVEVGKCATYFDLVVIDNPLQEEGGHFEHFDIFPQVGYILSDRAALVLNVMPVLRDRYCEIYPRIYTVKHLQARAKFYNAVDSALVSLVEMHRTYFDHLYCANRRLTWWFIQPRNDLVSYFVCGVGVL
jgi:hypothetical protein